MKEENGVYQIDVAPKCLGTRKQVKRTVEGFSVANFSVTGACANTTAEKGEEALKAAATSEYAYEWTDESVCESGCGCEVGEGREVASEEKTKTYTNVQFEDDCAATGTLTFTVKKFRRECECMPTA